MTKRICPSCGLGAYSSDTGRVWICEACNTEIPPSCAVEVERCKPESEIERAIVALTMCQELMLFDPMTGETHELSQENRDNQELYNACTVAIAAFREKQEREKGCEYCNGFEAEYQHTIHTKLSINTFGNARTIVTECNPCPPHANCCIKGVPTRCAFVINYCPECGRNLKEAQNG